MAIKKSGALKGKLSGTDELLRNLRKEIKLIDGDLSDGLKAAAAFIKGEAQDLAPVDFGVLMASAFSDVVRAGKRIVARVGFTAKYAPWVHEMPMTLKGKPRKNFGKTGTQSAAGPVQSVAFGGGSGKGNYWDGGENKFLEKAVTRNTNTILKILRRKAKR